MKNILIITTVLIYSSGIFAQGLQINYKKIAVFLAQDPNQINIPSVELYRDLKKSIDKSDDWVVAPSWSVKLNLRNQNDGREFINLGAIAAFDRKYLLSSHPEANKILPETQIENKKNIMVRPVQIVLDTLALEGAIIVDCHPEGSQVVRNCGLYYYDRSKGKIVASSKKYFRAGVTNASSWSEHLLLAMSKGLKKVKERKIQSKLDQILSYTESPTEVFIYSMGLAFSGTHVNGDMATTVPSSRLTIFKDTDNFSYGLGFVYANLKNSEFKYDQIGLDVIFTPRTFAAKSLIWELPMGVGVSQRTLAASAGQSLQQIDGKIFLGPSLLWSINKQTSVGLGASLDYYLNLKSDTQGSENLSLFERNVKYSFRVKFQL